MKLKKIIILFLFFLSLKSFSQLSFSTVTSLTGVNALTVAIGDLNNDCLNDVIIGTGYTANPDKDFKIFIFLQNKEEKLDEPISIKYAVSLYHNINGVKIVDINNDLLNDIVLTYGDSLKIFYQDNGGKFTEVVNFYSGNVVNGMDVGDLNNDGLNDIAISHWADKFINVFYQNADKSFTKKVYNVSAITQSGQLHLGQLLVDDINNDGLDDIITFYDMVVLVYYQSCSAFGIDKPINYQYFNANYGPEFNSICVGNLGDSNGKNSLVMTAQRRGAFVATQKQNGYLVTTPGLLIDSVQYNPAPVKIADFDNDGKNEIAIGENSFGYINICTRNADDSYSVTKLDSRNHYINPNSMATGDINNDGLIDIVVGFGGLIIHYNTSSVKGNFNYKNQSITQFKPCQTIVTDTITEKLTSIRTVSGIDNNCSYTMTYEKEILNQYLAQKGIGDSIITMNNCTHRSDTIKRNQIVYKKNLLFKSDTVNTIIDTNYTFPDRHIQQTIFGKDTICGDQQNVMYSVSQNENYSFSWTVSGGSFTQPEANTISVNSPDKGNILVSVIESDKNGCSGPVSTKEVKIRKITDCIFIPNVFTPNEDGTNDFFEIKNLNLYPNNRLMVYNRWGSKVYQTENYTGTWKAENIPDGIYFYSFEVNQKPESKGWVQILR